MILFDYGDTLMYEPDFEPFVYAAQTATAARSICPPAPVTAQQKMSPCVYAGLGTALLPE